MVEYKCPTCGKIFNNKSHFNDHLKKINPCKKKSPDDGFKCEHCDKTFTRKDNLNRHITKMHHNASMNAETIKNAIVGGENNNITINKNKFYLMPFGTYCLEKDLSVEDSVKIFSSKSGAIETIILKTHLNPKLPQYHNCGITDLHLSYGIVYDGNNWIYKPISDIMHDLIENGQKESYELYEQIKNFIQDDFHEEIKNDLNDDKFLLYPRHNKDDKKSKKELIKYLKSNFYNQRELVKTSIKNSGKQVMGGEKLEHNDVNILKDGVTYQDIEEHMQKYQQIKGKISLKKELSIHILDQFNNIIDSKYDELYEKINKTNDIEIMNIITRLLIKSLCGQIDINKLELDKEIDEIKKINAIFCP